MNSEIQPVHLGEVTVGDGHDAVLAVEIGTFFNRDIGLAQEYLNRAIAAGAPVFKTEILHNADICLAGTGLTHKFTHATGQSVEDYRALIERKTVPLSDYRKLLTPCHDRGVPFIASVYDFTGIDFLADIGAAGIKIARNNINNVPLIRHAAKTGLPVIFDAGEVTVEEVNGAVTLARDEGAGGVVVLHHPGANPAPAEMHNLRMINFYRDRFAVVSGLSCHYRGTKMLYLAIAAGASLLEKGFDADPGRAEQDIISAAAFDELADILEQVKLCSSAMGTAPVEPPGNRDLSVRAGLCATRYIAPGDKLNQENTGFAFPPLGISVEEYDKAMGATAARAIGKGMPIGWDDIDAQS